MVGLRVAAASAVLAAAALVSGRASACVSPPPIPALAGVPAAGERNVPTDVIPVFSYIEANSLSEQTLGQATFQFASATSAVSATARPKYAWQFEVVPDDWLEPQTEYTLEASLPPVSTGQPGLILRLSFATGDGPYTGTPDLPYAVMQHYHSTGNVTNSCEPNPSGSCIFFPPGIAAEYQEEDAGFKYLLFGPWWTNLSGVDQGTPWKCATLRTRALDGSLSGIWDVCREEAESFTIPGVMGLECTENGLTKNGIPLGAGGTGGSDPGGTGGTGTGGSGNSAGAPEPDPDDGGTRTVITEGCGCDTPGRAKKSKSAIWFAIAAVFLAHRAVRGRRRP